MFEPSQEVIWKMAQRLAILFNGGEWQTHYTPKQMLLWAERAKAILHGGRDG